MDDKKARSWATLCHLSALSTYIGIPLGNIIGPLIFWLVKKNDHPFIDDQGKEALNFQLSITLYALIAVALIFVIIGIPILIGLALFDIVFVIIAAVKASNGEKFRYPLTIPFVK